MDSDTNSKIRLISKVESVAICLFGISYKNTYNHWVFGKKDIDYRKSIENYRQRIMSRVRDYGVFCSTYDNVLINNLIVDYNPKHVIVSKEDTLEGLTIESLLQRNNMISKFETVLENTSYQWYLFTRFDLLLNFNIDEYEYDSDKINVLAFLENKHVICDNFYMVSKAKLGEFFKYIKRKDITGLNRHYINFFGGIDNINVLTNENGKLVKDLNCYKILSNP